MYWMARGCGCPDLVLAMLTRTAQLGLDVSKRTYARLTTALLLDLKGEKEGEGQGEGGARLLQRVFDEVLEPQVRAMCARADLSSPAPIAAAVDDPRLCVKALQLPLGRGSLGSLLSLWWQKTRAGEEGEGGEEGEEGEEGVREGLLAMARGSAVKQREELVAWLEGALPLAAAPGEEEDAGVDEVPPHPGP